MNWATSTETKNAQNTKDLPPFAWTYVPDANGAAVAITPTQCDALQHRRDLRIEAALMMKHRRNFSLKFVSEETEIAR